MRPEKAKVKLGIGTQLIVLATNTPEHPQDFPTSPWGISFLIAWSGAAAFVWGHLKYSPKAGTLLFFLATSVWFLPFLGRADLPEEIMSADFAHRMFYSCLTAMIVSMIRLVLGEGRQQTKTLKRLFFGDADVSDPPVTPKETLLRSSSQPAPLGELLLRPATDVAETVPEQLLRASRSEDQ